jgi:hypothetical protein
MTRAFPIIDEYHTRRSLFLWSIPAVRDQFSKCEQKRISKRLAAAAKRFGIKTSLKQ